MGRNVFISYKYGDYNVHQFENSDHMTSSRDYVDVIANKIEDLGQYYYRGEEDGDDLTDWPREAIRERLSDMIFHTSITICLISPGMIDHKREKYQWIPWEISYSLKNKKRSDGNSNTNAILAIVLPNEEDSYDYAIHRYSKNGLTVHRESFFNMMLCNMFNRIGFDVFFDDGDPIYYPSNSYIALTTWDRFRSCPKKYLDLSVRNRGEWDQFNIVKGINPKW